MHGLVDEHSNNAFAALVASCFRPPFRTLLSYSVLWHYATLRLQQLDLNPKTVEPTYLKPEHGESFDGQEHQALISRLA